MSLRLNANSTWILLFNISNSTSISLSLILPAQLVCFVKNGKSGLDETVLKKYMTKLYPVLWSKYIENH